MRPNRISADCHLDLIWLPPDLFVWEAPQALKGACPTWPTARTGRAGASGTKYVPGKQLRVEVMAATIRR